MPRIKGVLPSFAEPPKHVQETTNDREPPSSLKLERGLPKPTQKVLSVLTGPCHIAQFPRCLVLFFAFVAPLMPGSILKWARESMPTWSFQRRLSVQTWLGDLLELG